MIIELSKSVFNKNTILKTVYLWQECFSINIKENEFNYVLEVVPIKPDMVFDENSFNMQLNEQQLRETLNEQFGSLRNAVYEKAFSIIKKDA